MSPVFLIVFFVCAAGGIAYLSHQAELKRTRELTQFASENRFIFSLGKDHGFSRTFHDFDILQTGSKRYAHYMITGEREGMQCMACEYHYQTYSTDSNGRRNTHHHWSTLVMLKPDFHLKPLVIRREGILDKMKGAFGWDDIDFSSAEFSRCFHVNAPDRDWAFAVVQPGTMNLLLKTKGLEFHMQQGWLMLRSSGRITLRQLDESFSVATRLLALIPDFCRQQL